MKMLLPLILISLALGGLARALDATGRSRGGHFSDRTTAPDNEPAPVPSTRFTAVDVFIDPAGKPLAAYQFELKAKGGQVKLVGVEGGEHAAFRRPPYYDAKANVHDRVVIAGFDTGDDLPAARTRVARLMVAVTGSPAYAADLQVAASGDGKLINATISVSEAATNKTDTSEGAGQ